MVCSLFFFSNFENWNMNYKLFKRKSNWNNSSMLSNRYMIIWHLKCFSIDFSIQKQIVSVPCFFLKSNFDEIKIVLCIYINIYFKIPKCKLYRYTQKMPFLNTNGIFLFLSFLAI